MQVSKAQFEKWVVEAIDSIPEKFQKMMNNLAFFVEDYPRDDQLKKMKFSGKKGVSVFGLYEGYHQFKKTRMRPVVLPDRITIFKKSIENYSETEEELKKQIFSTVKHEIAHYFGSNEYGARRASRGH